MLVTASLLLALLRGAQSEIMKRLQVPGIRASKNAIDVLVDRTSLKLFYNGTEYYINGVAYNPVPIGYKHVAVQEYGFMSDGSPLGFGGLCKSIASPEPTPTGEVSKVSACYDSDYAKALTGGDWPIGNWFGELWERDFALMRDMGINSIRLYNVNPKNAVSCRQIPGYCHPKGHIPDHRPMFREAAAQGLTVLWPLPTQSERAWGCLDPAAMDPQLDPRKLDVRRHRDSPVCRDYWAELRGIIDEVATEPNLLMWCFGNEDIAASYLLDETTGGLTPQGAFRVAMHNELIWTIRNYTQAEHGRVLPVTHATFGSPGAGYINLFAHLDVDVFGTNPYGGAVLANNEPFILGGPWARKWPKLAGFPQELAPPEDKKTEWPGQVYLNWLHNKPTMATEWGNQPPKAGQLCLAAGKIACGDGCSTLADDGGATATMGLTECQEQAGGNYGYQWGPATSQNPSEYAWLGVFRKGMLEAAAKGGLIGGYFFEWTNEYFSKRDDWTQRALGLYNLTESHDSCKTDGGSAGAGWGVDVTTLTPAGEAALNGYHGPAGDFRNYSFRSDPFEVLGRKPLLLEGQPTLPPPPPLPRNAEGRRPSEWGADGRCFLAERTARCVSRRDVPWNQTDDAVKAACKQVEHLEIKAGGALFGCTLLQQATYVLNALHARTGECDPAVATLCETPPCVGEEVDGRNCFPPLHEPPPVGSWEPGAPFGSGSGDSGSGSGGDGILANSPARFVWVAAAGAAAAAALLYVAAAAVRRHLRYRADASEKRPLVGSSTQAAE